MTHKIKSIILQSTFFIKLFRYFEGKLNRETAVAPDLKGLNLEQLKRTYRKTGCVTIKKYFTKEQCDQLLSMLDKAHDHYDELVDAGLFRGINSDKNFTEDNKRAVYWYNFSNKNNDVNNFVNNKELHQLCEYLISSKAKNIVYWVKQVDGNLAKHAKYLTNEKYHADSVGLNAIRVLVYLNDITREEDGPFYYVQETHLNKPLVSSLYSPLLEKYCNSKAEPILGEAGDVILVDINGYHKAGRPISGLRSTLQILYVSETADFLNRLFNYTTYVKEAKNEGAVS
jgi:hypothetical protein